MLINIISFLFFGLIILLFLVLEIFIPDFQYFSSFILMFLFVYIFLAFIKFIIGKKHWYKTIRPLFVDTIPGALFFSFFTDSIICTVSKFLNYNKSCPILDQARGCISVICDFFDVDPEEYIGYANYIYEYYVFDFYNFRDLLESNFYKEVLCDQHQTYLSGRYLPRLLAYIIIIDKTLYFYRYNKDYQSINNYLLLLKYALNIFDIDFSEYENILELEETRNMILENLFKKYDDIINNRIYIN